MFLHVAFTILSTLVFTNVVESSNNNCNDSVPVIHPSIEDSTVIGETDNHNFLKISSKKIMKLYTTPYKLGWTGNLPSGYDEIVFSLVDSNWIEHINLPLKPSDKSIVRISSTATHTAKLNTVDVNVPMQSLDIVNGNNLTFQYSTRKQKWIISGKDVNYLVPTNNGNSEISPTNATGILFYSMFDGNWTPKIKLPPRVKDGTFVVVRSDATYKSKVLHDNMLYASTMEVIRNDEYAFKYLADFNGWVVDTSPTRLVQVNSENPQIPYPTAQRTLVIITEENWISRIKLPEVAGNRDKLLIRSNTTFGTVIDGSNVNTQGVMILHREQQYDFTYIAENKKWELMKSPNTTYQAKSLVDGKVPSLFTPCTIIIAQDGNYKSPLELPNGQLPGSRVIIDSSATLTLDIFANNKNYPVYTGEIVAFKVDDNKLWYRETITIDLLLLYSDKAEDKLGETKVQRHLIDSLKKTNEALENSGATFRYRKRGMKKIVANASWETLEQPLRDLCNNSLVRTWRDSLRADLVIYLGTEDGCGLAWVKATKFHMTATASINCDITLMRHELGHLMGLTSKSDSESYNVGYSQLKTIMEENYIPYFSTPKRYTLDYGVPMGIVDEIDGIRAMNEFAPTVAGFR